MPRSKIKAYLVFLNHESAKHVELLDSQRTRSFFGLIFGQLHQQPGGLQEVVGLPVEFDGLQDLLLVQEMLSILGKKRGYLETYGTIIRGPIHSFI